MHRLSLGVRIRELGADPALRHAALLFAVSRIALSLWAALVLTLTRPPTSPDDVLRPYQGVEPISGGAGELLLGVWQRFDTMWYLRIAEQGYSPDDGSTVYFPLYPLLIRLLGKVLLGNYLVAALLISNLAYIAALYCLYKLAEKELGRSIARRSSVYLAVFPTAFFFLAAYTESLFVLLTLAAFMCAHEKRWGLAGFLGLLTSLTRLQGVVLLCPLLYMYLRQRGFRLSAMRPDVLGPLIVPLGAALFLAYQHLVLGSAPLLSTYQTQLHAQFVWPWDNIAATVRQILSPQGTFIDALNLTMTGVFLAMAVTTWRKLPLEYGIYMAVTMFVLLLRRTTLQPLVSMSRYVLVLFPAFMLWGRWGGNPRVQRLIVYPSVALLLYLSGQFVMWGWVG
ncbi:MAG: mannosyltransferase family protein [Anaerolineae bacterium]|nr:mannosyltransferase family protein [Anaerolineae bacterium]